MVIPYDFRQCLIDGHCDIEGGDSSSFKLPEDAAPYFRTDNASAIRKHLDCERLLSAVASIPVTTTAVATAARATPRAATTILRRIPLRIRHSPHLALLEVQTFDIINHKSIVV